MKLEKEGNSCSTCWGYGLWDLGDPTPMGPMDASDGMPTQACPECGANPNPLEMKVNLGKSGMDEDIVG